MEKIAIALQRTLKSEPDHQTVYGRIEQVSSGATAQVRVPGQIRYSRTRTIDVAPHVLERHRVAAITNDLNADAFRLLRTQLLVQMKENGWRTLAITSPNKGAGKSTVALNLAISLAMEVDHTALLVDADLRDPDLRKILEMEEGPGLADYLVNDSAIPDLLLHPKIGNLVLLPGGAPVSNTSELMRSPMMEDLVRELRDRYTDRFVLFDVPPILSGADTLALSGYMDAIILLVEECGTTREELERALGLLKGTNLLGIVLNKSRELPEPDPIRTPERGFWSRLFLGDD